MENMVVNYFLAANKPEDFDTTAADVNKDGSVTMADANQIVNMFLSGEKGLTERNRNENTSPYGAKATGKVR